MLQLYIDVFFFSSRRRHTRFDCDWSSDVCSSDLALVTFAGIDKVILVENGKALEKAVTVGRRGDNWIEIKAGINLGQTVVIDPGSLQSGQSVTIDTQ